jgi:hypothetical protein
MTLIIILNAVFAAFVLVGVLGLQLYAIAKDHAEHAHSQLVQGATSGPAGAPAPHGRAGRGRVAERESGVVSVQRRAAKRAGPAAELLAPSALGQPAEQVHAAP